MEIKQVLSLSLFLVENELSEDKESSPTWKQELKEAKKTLKLEIAKYQKPAGRFFISPSQRVKALNSKQNAKKV